MFYDDLCVRLVQLFSTLRAASLADRYMDRNGVFGPDADVEGFRLLLDGSIIYVASRTK